MKTGVTKKPAVTKLDYTLTGINATKAIESGLAEADWYQTPVPQKLMRELLVRRDGPAIRDTLLLFAILLATAYLTIVLWGTWWAVIPYLIYAVFYGTSSDSRWHECGHGTAFRTDWLNNLVYGVSSFMVMRESHIWRWSHIRHHSDTIIVGRDPEIQLPRPPDIKGLILSLFNLQGYKTYYANLFRHAFGKMSDAEKTYVPESEFQKVFKNARFILIIYLTIIASAVLLQTWIPIFLFILPQFFGTWLMIIHNTTQHAGLAENVLDHRLNCRTVYMNPVSRFIYWNMNYHTEHHMFPLVPYHALPKLHELVKDDCAPVYPSIYSAWKEILPTLIRQLDDPAYHIKRKLPEAVKDFKENVLEVIDLKNTDGWLNIGNATLLGTEDVLRLDHEGKTYAIYRDALGNLYATDGMCTHGNTHLSDGLVKGSIIECPKHNGRFNLKDGSPARAPICRGLVTYPIEERDGQLWVDLLRKNESGVQQEKLYELQVISSRNVATFIKEVILKPVEKTINIGFTPGDYIQLVIPSYERIAFKDIEIDKPYRQVWEEQGVFDLISINPGSQKRNNYSIASNRKTDEGIKLNVRIATPPPGQDCSPGVGSSYVFALKPGDRIWAVEPVGNFHIKSTQKEMVYIGGGAGMAPIRAHLAELFENEHTGRKVSYWYGARSKQELFYDDYFKSLAHDHPNFSFHVALSSPIESDDWEGPEGFIHEVVLDKYLRHHHDLHNVEFYLCGPPMMIKACIRMLTALGVSNEQVAFDEF